jgi:hypothetical protein
MGIEVSEVTLTLESPDFGRWHITASPSFGEDFGGPNLAALLAALAAAARPLAPATTLAPSHAADAPLAADDSPRRHPWSDRAAALAGDLDGSAVRAVVAPDSMGVGSPDTNGAADPSDPNAPKVRRRNVPKGGRRNHRWTDEEDNLLLEMCAQGRTTHQMAGAVKRERQAVKHRLYNLEKQGHLDATIRLALR